MRNIKIISRADDAGSSNSANDAILQVIKAGFIKNVSLMATGQFINSAAEMFAKETTVCFGLHCTLNAEWDNVKWGPVSNIGKDSGLLDDNGYLLPHPAIFKETKPNIDTVIKEYNAQLDVLTRLGFNISYVDSHMFEEYFVQGLMEAKKEWAKSKGLIYHMDCKSSPGYRYDKLDINNLGESILSMPDGQYLYVVHPALYSDEMLQTGHEGYPGERVAKERARETEVMTDPVFIEFTKNNGIHAIRYDEAEQN